MASDRSCRPQPENLVESHSSDIPLSVLLVTAMYPDQEQPGAGAFVMHQAEQLRAMGHQVEVIHIKGYQSRWNYLSGAVSVLRATWKRRYDVVHVHYGLTGLSALIRWRTPMVVTLHGSDVLQSKLQLVVSKFVSAVADSTIVVSQELASHCPGTLIPCGVDLEVFRPLDRSHARQQLGLQTATKYVLFPFNPTRRLKRYDLAENAVQRLRRRRSDVSLLCVWNVPNHRMPLYYSAADAMLLCSDTEGSPTSVKEALACNLPIVATDVGDVRTLLQTIEGTEICGQSTSAIAAALERVLDRTAPFDGRSAMSVYDQTKIGEAVVNVYNGVVRRASRVVPVNEFTPRIKSISAREAHSRQSH